MRFVSLFTHARNIKERSTEVSLSLDQQREILKLVADNLSFQVSDDTESDYGRTYKHFKLKISIHDPETKAEIETLTEYFSIDFD